MTLSEEMAAKIDADREEQQDRELVAYEARKLTVRKKAEAVADAESVNLRRLVLISAADIIPEEVQWLWEGRIPMGEITAIAGKGGVGKSTLFAWFVAKLTTGKLKGQFYGKPQHVIYIASEDSFNKTVIPRFMAAGADRSRVHLVKMENVLTGKTGSLNLPLDCDLLKDAIRQTGAVAVFIDPLSSSLKGVKNRNDGTQMREALEQIRDMAEEMNVALPVLAHLRKMGASTILEAMSGSGEFANVVRAALGVAADPDGDTPTYILSQEKNNLGRLDMPSWRYQIVSRSVVDHSTGVMIEKPLGKVKFIEETDTTASEILEDAMTGSRTGEAMEWLGDRLKDGKAASADILKAAQKDGISRATLYRAADRMKIQKSTRDGFQGASMWQLPTLAGVPLNLGVDS